MNKLHQLAVSREQQLQQLENNEAWDLVIIGGGITGAGILKLASQLGLKVLLLEQKDFAWGSSSRSSKMVHGGLRYIAEGQVKLTKESVKQRQHLIESSNGLVQPQSFVLGHYKNKFPGPKIFNFLLSIYDLFAGKKQHRYWPKKDYLFLVPGAECKDSLGATQFVDAMTDDSRLVQRLIQESQLRGSLAINYMEVTELLKADGKIFGVKAKSESSDREISIKARMTINATGAWVNKLFSHNAPQVEIRPLRGSHLIISSWRLPVASAISVPHPKDKRPVQIYPWQNVTVVGTTDVEHTHSLSNEPSISQEEFDYLMECIAYQFPSLNIRAKDVISTFSGVRPVIASGELLNPSQEKREHQIWKETGLINIAGGKLTTFRLIAKEVIQLLKKEKYFAAKLNNTELNQLTFDLPPSQNKSELSDPIVNQIKARFGCLYADFIQTADQQYHQPISYSCNLWSELVWALKFEQVLHLDDLLLRRTHVGNVLPNGASSELERIGSLCKKYLSWDESMWQLEKDRYQKLWKRYYSLPQS